MQKKVKTVLILATILVVLGGAGSYGFLLYRSAAQIEVDIEHVYITRLAPGGTLLNPTMDVDLEIHALVTTSGAVTVAADYVTFDVALDGDNYGEGQTRAIKVSQTPSTVVVDVGLVGLGGGIYLDLAALLLPGASLLVTITITGVRAFGMDITLSEDIDVVVTSEDVL